MYILFFSSTPLRSTEKTIASVFIRGNIAIESFKVIVAL